MAFEDALAAWLPAQRWYPGSASPRGLTITSDVTLVSGDPELRHLLVTVPGAAAGGATSYQLLAGVGSRLPALGSAAGAAGAAGAAAIGPVGSGRLAYDALHDPRFTGILLRGIANQRTAGPLRFAAVPGAVIDTSTSGRVLAGEQSNTSLIFGESAILKVLRRVSPGQNPDLEVTRALAERGSVHVKKPLGWIELRGSGEQGSGRQGSGEPVVLAILSRYLPAAGDGWSLAAASLRAVYTGRTLDGGDFADEAYRLGTATAKVHADLAAAFGTHEISAEEVRSLAGQMTRKLDNARAEVPQLGRYAGKLRGYFADIAAPGRPMRVQRVHGDYHLGQVLRTPAGWVALDFEGEPAVPLAERRAPAPALRDVAGMLRSFQYAARHSLLGRTDERDLRDTAAEWVRRSQAAFCAGYAAAGWFDPAADAGLLRALVLDKAVYEVVYEARHRPSWLPIPLDAIADA